MHCTFCALYFNGCKELQEYAKQYEIKHRRKIILPCVIPWESGSNKYASQKGTGGFGTIRNAVTPIKCSKQLSESNDGVVPWMSCPQLHDKELASQAGLTPFGGIREHVIKVQDKEGERKKDISKLVGDQSSECILKIWSQANPNAKNGQLFGKHRDAITNVRGGRQLSQEELNASRAAIPKFHDPRETVAAKAKKAHSIRSDRSISNKQAEMEMKNMRGRSDDNVADSNYMAWIGGQITLRSKIQSNDLCESPASTTSKSYFDRVTNGRGCLRGRRGGETREQGKVTGELEFDGRERRMMNFTALYRLLHLCVIAILLDGIDGSMEFSEHLVSDSEIVNLVNQFRLHDVNKANDGQIILDYQRHTTGNDPIDRAQRRFFKRVDAALLEKNTYKKWRALSNKFIPDVGIEESNTPEKQKAIDDFLDAILNTTIWQNFFQFLKTKGHPYAANFGTFRASIKQLWFEGYSRNLHFIDTSGFEHVFMGEYKNGDVSGMHSWLRFYLLEQNASQQFDYRGYTAKRFDFMAAVKFSWRNHLKRYASFFIGTSPEFDLALYTLCFITRQSRNKCKVEIDGCPFFITSFNFKQRGKTFVGTVYPVSGPFTQKCREYNSDKYHSFLK
ncbi:unnamed protein product [Litomosoides sigmodontis]|uniref:EndoU domain-containing protein n=1 Tax=Litomosoides sigmodontis TaxID=42156 RepID=A0A3P6U049_LITSI|nr:unnamed protein product [Litomosoides sigmodontis]